MGIRFDFKTLVLIPLLKNKKVETLLLQNIPSQGGLRLTRVEASLPLGAAVQQRPLVSAGKQKPVGNPQHSPQKASAILDSTHSTSAKEEKSSNPEEHQATVISGTKGDSTIKNHGPFFSTRKPFVPQSKSFSRPPRGSTTTVNPDSSTPDQKPTTYDPKAEKKRPKSFSVIDFTPPPRSTTPNVILSTTEPNEDPIQKAITSYPQPSKPSPKPTVSSTQRVFKPAYNPTSKTTTHRVIDFTPTPKSSIYHVEVSTSKPKVFTLSSLLADITPEVFTVIPKVNTVTPQALTKVPTFSTTFDDEVIPLQKLFDSLSQSTSTSGPRASLEIYNRASHITTTTSAPTTTAIPHPTTAREQVQNVTRPSRATPTPYTPTEPPPYQPRFSKRLTIAPKGTMSSTTSRVDPFTPTTPIPFAPIQLVTKAYETKSQAEKTPVFVHYTTTTTTEKQPFARKNVLQHEEEISSSTRRTSRQEVAKEIEESNEIEGGRRRISTTTAPERTVSSTSTTRRPERASTVLSSKTTDKVEQHKTTLQPKVTPIAPLQNNPTTTITASSMSLLTTSKPKKQSASTVASNVPIPTTQKPSSKVTSATKETNPIRAILHAETRIDRAKETPTESDC
ncbi:mucin-2-like [Hetaerina americana]|uniref:mucin-2-like n=1 Tax=Hetaerina americana TaxID=62018 RepID=UPI003A7F3495